MKAKKGYTNEDLYKMLRVAQEHPNGGYGGQSFWERMLTEYGSSFFGSVEAGALRSRWRKIIKVIVAF